MDTKPIVGYWDLRGIAEPIRYMLHYLGVDYEDRRYSRLEAFGPENPDWVKDREEFGFIIPNLPYYVDGNVRLTQRTVIMRYLAQKHALFFPEGQSKDGLMMDMLEVIAKDLMDFIRLFVFNENCHKNIAGFAPKMEGLVSQVSQQLGDKKWLLGDNISHVDFLMFDDLDVVTAMYPNMVEKYPNLDEFKKRFKELPGVKEYRSWSTKWPVFRFSYWGSEGEPPKSIL